MRKIKILSVCLLSGLILPLSSRAQGGMAESIYSLHSVLERLFDQMLPLSSRMMVVGQAIAGFAALTYIAFRVWRHIARAEPVDMFPLLRPFAIGIVIMLFQPFLGLLNGVLKPVVTATAAMGDDARKAIVLHIEYEQQAAGQTPPAGTVPDAGSSDQWNKYEQPPDGTTNDQGFISGLRSAFSLFNIETYCIQLIGQLTEVLYTAAGLCIDTIRTFYLIVLVILGPLVLGLSIFDGFQHTLTTWIARYINVFMWLPVSNIFGAITAKILDNMMNIDQNFYSTTAYIIFMIISIVGYTTVPSVANYIVHAGGGRDTLLHKISSATQQSTRALATAML